MEPYVEVRLGPRSYQVRIAAGLLSRCGAEVADVELGPRAVVVTNDVVGPLYAGPVQASLEERGVAVRVVTLPDGEVHKSLATAERLYHELAAFRMDRTSWIAALGGGVVGDLAGFVAATYMRGIAFVNFPTTLLAQVDSAVGGKTGVDLPEGKNLVGAFYQPRRVLCDLAVLTTLPREELIAGMAEVVKYGVILDADFFAFVEAELPAILNRDTGALTEVVRASCAAKAAVVEADETEAGRRAVLNFGHTLGHAFETLTGYSGPVHGQAVAMGMVAAARLARAMGLCDVALVERLCGLLERIGLPTEPPPLNPERVLEVLAHDKKVRRGRLVMVLPRAIGSVEIRDDVDTELIREVLRPRTG